MLIACGLALAPALASSASAQPVVTEQDRQQETPLADKARKIDALIAGQLPPSENVDDLFAADLSAGGMAQTRELLRLLASAADLEAAEARLAQASTDVSPTLVLSVAQAKFLRLPEAERARLLTNHRRQADAAATEAEATRAEQQQLARLQATVDALQHFLAGEVSDTDLLGLPLLQSDRHILDPEQRGNLAETPASQPSDDASIDDRVRALQEQISSLRAQILVLPEETYVSLAAAQAAPERARAAEIAAAEARAADAEQAAQEAARQADAARTEIERLAAGERNRLELARQRQAEFEATLARQAANAREASEVALRWRRQVTELQMQAPTPTREAQADALYGDLVLALQSVRSQLDVALNKQAAFESPPAQIDPALPEDQVSYPGLVSLRETLADQANVLRDKASAQLLEERSALYSAMVEMNEQRLELIASISPQLRSRVVGFGEAGAAQVGRELNQIVLAGRYTLASLPQLLGETLRPLTRPTPQTIFSILFAGLAFAVYMVWNRTGETLLSRAEIGALTKRPRTLFSAIRASVFGFLRDVRRPATFLVLLVVFRWLLEGIITFPGDRLVWLALFWILLGWFLLEAVNSLLRNRRRADPRAELRRRSLRLLATIGASIGLALSFTGELVGAGAIHNWVLVACWLIVPPVLLVIANWWSVRIRDLASKGAARSQILGLAIRHQTGIVGQVTLVAAAVHLIVSGIWGIAARRLKDIALIRELSDQRRRQKVEAQAAADAASGLYQPISDMELAALDPHRRPLEPNPALRNPAALATLPKLEPGRLAVVVGERGLGKTTFIDDSLREFSEDSILRLRIDADGIEGLLSRLSSSCVHGEDIIQAGSLHAAGIRVVAVDDTQRLVAPAIGGLNGLDRLIAISRIHQKGIVWVLAMGELAMSYVSRARSGRVLFDAACRLPRWEATDLRRLIERRTEQAGFVPSFAGLRDVSIDSLTSDETPEQRGRRIFFEELVHYARGNPAIALEFWRRSLFRNTATGQVEVRTFARPPLSVLSELPEQSMFVLRTIAQMEVVDANTIQRCTDLPAIAVEESVRRLEILGVILPHGEGYRLALFWYAEVLRLLERQNLLAASTT